MGGFGCCIVMSPSAWSALVSKIRQGKVARDNARNSATPVTVSGRGLQEGHRNLSRRRQYLSELYRPVVHHPFTTQPGTFACPVDNPPCHNQ
jgi:hypothetical protein